MGDRSSEIISEIKQLHEQYRQEVPGRRRPWPESIKRRALELCALGVNCTQVSKETGLPYFTVLKWKREKGAGFSMVKVVAKRKPEVATVTVAKSATEAVLPAAVATVTVAMPGGVRIEGVSFEFLERLLPLLGETR